MSKYNDNRSIRVLAFLEAYERQECLWDTSLDSYKNKGDRDQAYMAIIKELNIPSLTVHDIKLKVKGIRTTYTKELRILNAHKKMGKSYKPKLFWFNRANAFLKNVCVSKRMKKESHRKYEPVDQSECKTLTTDYADQVYSGEEMIADGELNEHDRMQSNDIQEDYKTFIHVARDTDTDDYDHTPIVDQSYNEEPQSTDAQRLNNKMEQTTTVYDNLAASLAAKEDEFDLFCRSVAGQLRAISDSYSRAMAKLKIQQILFEAETGHYKNSPCVTIPIVQQINGV